MAMVEIDETQLANYQRTDAIARKITAHPEARALMQKAALMAVPDDVGPEPRLRQEFDDKFSKLDEKLTKFLDGQSEDKAKREQEERRSGLERQWVSGRQFARDQGYTEDGLKTLEDFMEKEGIASHKHAIASYERENPPPPPVMTGGSRWNFFDQQASGEPAADLKPLFDGREEAWLGSQIQRALTDVRNQR